MKKLMQAMFLAALVALPSSGWSSGEEIAVIVNPKNGVQKLDRAELRAIFQTQRVNWEGGERILPLNLPQNDASRMGFDSVVLGLDADRVTRYWIDRKIRGGARPPKRVPSESLVNKVVSGRLGAIGYVPSDQVSADVKVVAKIVNGKVMAP